MLSYIFPLGRWFGIPVGLHWSWLLLIGLSLPFDPQGTLALVGLFAIVLLHELGHCLAGRYFGCETKQIVLYPFGGFAFMKISLNPIEELFIAVAGPLVNVAFIPILIWCESIYPDSYFVQQIQLNNLVMLIFNLVPSYPMDGGRIFRSLLALIWKDHDKATHMACRVSQCFCMLFAIIGILAFMPMLVFLGVLFFLATEGEIRRIQEQKLNRMLEDSIQKSSQAIIELQRREAEILAKFAQIRGEES